MKRGKPLSFDRNEALKSAMELFWRKGYEPTGMTELLEHMGIPRQSFYNTFGSKEEILFEAIALYGINLHSMLQEAIERGATPFEKIDCVFEFWAQENPYGCFVGNSVAEFGMNHEKVAKLMAEQLLSIRKILLSIFKEAIDRGDLPSDRDPEMLASTMLTYGQGLALIGKTLMDRKYLLGSIEIMKRSLKQ